MTNGNALAVYDPAEAAKQLTRAVKAKGAGIAALLGVDPDSPDPKEAARAKAMLDRFVTVALHAAISDPKILRATKESIVQSIRDSALLGLEPVGVTGDGAIVVYDERVRIERPSPRRDAPPGSMVIVEERVPVAHFQPMYRGLLKLARRSDQLAHVDAHVVYKGDKIELDLGSQPSVKHYPVLDGAERGDAIGAYAVAETREGRRYVDWMTTADIEQVRKSSRGGTASDSPWVKFWPEMARKTVLRRLMKRLPLETMAEHGLRLEAELEGGGRGSSGPSVAALEAPASSDARRRLRSRHVDETPDVVPPDASGAVAPPAEEETTDTAPAGDPDASGRPTGSEVVEGSFAPVETFPASAVDALPGVAGTPTGVTTPVGDLGEVCGAGSDPQLGDVETCILPPGHAHPGGQPTPHESKEGSRWPNR